MRMTILETHRLQGMFTERQAPCSTVRHFMCKRRKNNLQNHVNHSLDNRLSRVSFLLRLSELVAQESLDERVQVAVQNLLRVGFL